MARGAVPLPKPRHLHHGPVLTSTPLGTHSGAPFTQESSAAHEQPPRRHHEAH